MCDEAVHESPASLCSDPICEPHGCMARLGPYCPLAVSDVRRVDYASCPISLRPRDSSMLIIGPHLRPADAPTYPPHPLLSASGRFPCVPVLRIFPQKAFVRPRVPLFLSAAQQTSIAKTAGRSRIGVAHHLNIDHSARRGGDKQLMELLAHSRVDAHVSRRALASRRYLFRIEAGRVAALAESPTDPRHLKDEIADVLQRGIQ